MMQEDFSRALSEFLLLTRKKLLKPFVDCCRPLVSPLQFNALLMLVFWGPQSMSELAESMSLSKQQMTQIVNRLSESGYVRRVSDPSDKRRIIIELTEKSDAIIKDIKRSGVDVIAQAIGQLSYDDAKALYDSIETVNRILAK